MKAKITDVVIVGTLYIYDWKNIGSERYQ